MKKNIIFMLIILLLFSCFNNGKSKTNRIVMIIASKGFQQDELGIPKEILENKGYTVDVASSSADKAVGMGGSVIVPDLLIDDIKVENYDAVIFVGGTGSMEYYKNETTNNIINDAYKSDKIIAAICLAPNILVASGIAGGKEIACYSQVADFDSADVTASSETVVVDGNIITANGPGASEEFGNKIAEVLKKK